MAFESRVNRYIAEHSLIPEGGAVYVALSGGADSVALLSVLTSLGYDCVALHCNFHLRGDESMRDEAFVRSLCDALDVPLRVRDFDTQQYASAHKVSIEMAARDLRYEWFRAEACGAPIAVGHHIDDNVETLMLNLIRGTGIKGLCAMSPHNNGIIRPLLCVTRAEIVEYLQSSACPSHGVLPQSYVTDSTNLQDDYSRNMVRLDIIPQMQRINSAAVANIARTMANLSEVQAVYDYAMRQLVSECVTQDDGYIYINKVYVADSISPLALLHAVLDDYGFNRAVLQDILRVVGEGEVGRLFVSTSGVRLVADRTHLIVDTVTDRMPVCEHALSDDSEYDVRVLPVADVVIRPDKDTLYVDADKVSGELRLRPVRTGDSFVPFGMRGRKLVSDYLTDRKVNLFLKERQLVLCDSQDIVWVVSQRSSDRYKVDSATKSVIIVRKKKKNEG